MSKELMNGLKAQALLDAMWGRVIAPKKQWTNKSGILQIVDECREYLDEIERTVSS